MTKERSHLPYHPHAITIIPAWASFTFLADTSVRHAFIHFNTPNWTRHHVRRHFPRAFSFANQILLQRLRDLATTLHVHENRNSAALHMAQASALCVDILAAIIHQWPEHRQQQLWQSQEPQRLQPALHFIKENINQAIAVADCAEILGVGEARCIRLFKELIGQTPNQYILDQRVNVAAQRLVNTTDKLDVIAQDCGLPNRRYLSRIFKERTGINPKSYRQQFSQQH